MVSNRNAGALQGAITTQHKTMTELEKAAAIINQLRAEKIELEDDLEEANEVVHSLILSPCALEEVVQECLNQNGSNGVAVAKALMASNPPNLDLARGQFDADDLFGCYKVLQDHQGCYKGGNTTKTFAKLRGPVPTTAAEICAQIPDIVAWVDAPRMAKPATLVGGWSPVAGGAVAGVPAAVGPAVIAAAMGGAVAAVPVAMAGTAPANNNHDINVAHRGGTAALAGPAVARAQPTTPTICKRGPTGSARAAHIAASRAEASLAALRATKGNHGGNRPADDGNSRPSGGLKTTGLSPTLKDFVDGWGSN